MVVLIHWLMVVPTHWSMVVPTHWSMVVPTHWSMVVLTHWSMVVPTHWSMVVLIHPSMVVPTHQSMVVLIHQLMVVLSHRSMVVLIHQLMVVLTHQLMVVLIHSFIRLLTYCIICLLVSVPTPLTAVTEPPPTTDMQTHDLRMSSDLEDEDIVMAPLQSASESPQKVKGSNKRKYVASTSQMQSVACKCLTLYIFCICHFSASTLATDNIKEATEVQSALAAVLNAFIANKKLGGE